VLDYLIENQKIDVVARCQGGNNAGHTVIANGREYKFHLLPSGIGTEHCLNVIGSGVVVNLDSLFAEVRENGIDENPEWSRRLVISEQCHLVTDAHLQADALSESKLNSNKIGTTMKGIGPTYSTKCLRNGIRLADLMGNFDDFVKRYKVLVGYFRQQFPGVVVNEDEELVRFKKHAETLKALKLVKNTVVLLDELRLRGKSIIAEGANGAMLDVVFGTYPFVTSSNSTAGGVCTGLGLSPRSFGCIIGVAKAYTTRVGSGPFPTELLEADGETPTPEGDALQRIGVEFGVTSGRRRRCGWLDLFLLKYSALINGFTELALTKVDVLDSFTEIKVGVSYRLDGELLTAPPARVADWSRIVVEYKTFPGWILPTTEIRKMQDLPPKCRSYITFIEHYLDVPVKFVGVGQSRESLIRL